MYGWKYMYMVFNVPDYGIALRQGPLLCASCVSAHVSSMYCIPMTPAGDGALRFIVG